MGEQKEQIKQEVEKMISLPSVLLEVKQEPGEETTGDQVLQLGLSRLLEEHSSQGEVKLEEEVNSDRFDCLDTLTELELVALPGASLDVLTWTRRSGRFNQLSPATTARTTRTFSSSTTISLMTSVSNLIPCDNFK